MKVKNGVRVKFQRAEIGSGRYINDNPSKMSIAEYNELADANKSLAEIAKRGATLTDFSKNYLKTNFSSNLHVANESDRLKEKHSMGLQKYNPNQIINQESHR